MKRTARRIARPALRATLAPKLRIRRDTAWQLRYAEHAERALLDLLAVPRMPPAAQRASIEERLAGLRATLLASPYYAETLRSRGLAPGDLRRLGDLDAFPLLDRATLDQRQLDMPALDLDSLEARESVFVQSSGSTGDPVSILKDPYDCLHMWVVLRFFARTLRVELPRHPRVVLLCSLSNGIEYALPLPLLDDGRLERISIARPRAAARLRAAKPDVIFSDPAGLHWLSGLPRPPQPRLLLTSAQHFSRAQRTTLGSAVAAPLVNYYASSDAGPMAWECPRALGRFHVLLPDVWIESVAGEIVVSRLRPSVLPLLRFRTGDAGRVVDERCRCGYRGISIVDFIGRRACWLETPRGQRVDAWRLAWLFKHYPLSGFRLTQTTASRFELQLAAATAVDVGDLERRLRRALRVLGFDNVALGVTRVARLATEADKPEPFRSLCVSGASGARHFAALPKHVFRSRTAPARPARRRA